MIYFLTRSMAVLRDIPLKKKIEFVVRIICPINQDLEYAIILTFVQISLEEISKVNYAMIKRILVEIGRIR